MADTLDQFLRTSKRLYEEIKNELKAGKQGIDKFLFPIEDMSTSANFTLDRYVITPYGIVYRHPDEQAHVRPYQPGTGTIYEVPRASEKTPISEQLRDSVVAGIESTADFNQHHVKMLADIIRDHTVGHEITRWKRAIDVIRTGIFYALGIDGESIGLDVNFSRNAAQDITYDFTASGATIDKAFAAIYARGDAYGMSKDGRVVILGSDWLGEFQGDAGVLDKIMANNQNIIVQQNMTPPELQNTQGLYLIGQYLPEGCVSPLWICSFSPDNQYVGYKGATAADFLPSDEALLISLNSPRYRVYRGVDALDGSGNIQRVVGELVFDNYVEKDPPTEFFRSQTRNIFVPADINKTVRSTGTFDES